MKVISLSSLLKDNKKLMREYNFDKNIDVDLDYVKVGSHKKVWWKCSKGHEWEAEIKSRNGGRNCPYCGNKIALAGYNDLATTNPELAKEWNYEKNGDLTPTEIMSGSGRKVWWKCSKGHEWQTYVKSRKRGSQCPYCSKE